jgi:hypothetical protein
MESGPGEKALLLLSEAGHIRLKAIVKSAVTS